VGLLLTGAIFSSLVVDGRQRTPQERTATS